MAVPSTRHVTIRVGTETWTVPFGFGAAYKRCAGRGTIDQAEAEILRDVLELVGYTASLEDIQRWPLFKRTEAEVYCASVYMRAGDNPTPVPPRPSWMGEPWKGPRGTPEQAQAFDNNPTVLT